MEKDMKSWIKVLRKMNIHRRLVLAFSMTILIPTLIIASTNYFSYISHIEHRSMKNLELITNISFQLFQDELKRYETMTLQLNKNEELFAYLDIVKETESETTNLAISNILFDYAKEFNYISNLQIVTEFKQFSQVSQMGHMRGAYIEDLHAFNTQERMIQVKEAQGYPIWFDTTDETHIYSTQTNHSGTISDYLTLMRGMIHPDTKEQIATIVVNVDIRFIKNAINFNSFISDGNILFISEKGPLASLNENLDAPRIKDFSALITKIKQAQSLDKNIVQEDNSIIFFNELPQTEYFIIQVVDRHDLIKDALIVRNRNIIILMVCIILALSLAYGVTQSISEPIDKLALTMGGTKDKQLPSTYEDLGKDEVAELGLHYNKMLREIQDLIEELYVTEIKKNDAKLNALQMQIDPHFIYNTLDFMRWEAMDLTEGENNLSKMINDFSKLLRLSIKKGMDIVSIEEEINHVKAYLKLSNYRHDPPIELIVENKIGDFSIPKLTFQPLVENAIIHGFEEKVLEKTINIEVKKKQDIVEITISDNGKGIDEQALKQLNERLAKDSQDEGSIGLSNVNQRIKLYYGLEYGLFLQKNTQGGTMVIINLPFEKRSSSYV